MKDTVFHRPIPALTPWEDAGLQAMAQVLRDSLTPGCDCVGIARFGHTAACRIHQQYRDSVEQTICEAEELMLKIGDDHRPVYYDMFGRRAFRYTKIELKADIPPEFAPHNAGWRVLCKL